MSDHIQMSRISAVIVSFLIISCATQKKDTDLFSYPEDSKTMLIWEVKAQIKDLKTAQSQQVSLDIYILRPDLARIDVNGPMGVALASLVLRGSEMSYASYRQKIFYSGPSSEKAMKAVFRLAIDPRLIFNMSLDQAIKNNLWKCEVDGKNLPTICKSSQGTVSWKGRSGAQKTVLLTNNEFEVQLLYKGFSTKVLVNNSSPKGPFHLESPPGFNKYKVL